VWTLFELCRISIHDHRSFLHKHITCVEIVEEPTHFTRQAIYEQSDVQALSRNHRCRGKATKIT
jgi:hypothetical protein